MTSKKGEEKTKISKKAMLSAMEKTLGIVSTACQQVGITRQTHYRWMREDDKYKEKIENIEEKAIDFTESKLFQLISGIKLPETKVFIADGQIVTHETIRHFAPDTAAVIFHLKTKGKRRGYVEKQEMEHSGQVSAPQFTDAQIDKILSAVHDPSSNKK